MAEVASEVGPAATFRTVLDVAGVPLYTLDEHGRFTCPNDALVKRSGYSELALLGEHVSVLLDDGDVCRCRRAVCELLETGSRTHEVTVTAETADDERFQAELCISLLPLAGGFRGTVGVDRSAPSAADPLKAATTIPANCVVVVSGATTSYCSGARTNQRPKTIAIAAAGTYGRPSVTTAAPLYATKTAPNTPESAMPPRGPGGVPNANGATTASTHPRNAPTAAAVVNRSGRVHE